ncbi:MAG: exodeoxyribonuclease V subunit gamma [Candidatus Melainabacteria bacterium]|nr:exodeoxyribonuclease V subunit gamma [Candidatus Melainabacteria bacterium]
MVFSGSAFSYSIEGMPVSTRSAAVQGFLQLLKLPEERFAFSSVKELFSSTPFLEKNALTSDEVRQLFKWFEQAQIRYNLVEGPNSWEEGLDRLLLGLAHLPKQDAEYTTWPIGSIPHSEIDLFNRFLVLFSELKNDLAALFEERKAADWFALFVNWAGKYFTLEWEREPFFQELKSLALSTRYLEGNPSSFANIARIVRHLSESPSAQISTHAWQKIRFAPLRLGAPSCRLIWCLGMDEGAFPRSDGKSSLCAMSASKTKEYFPTKVDEDRALFLELLLKAQDYLIFSYERIDPKDAKHQGPSLVIEELDQYLIKHSAPIFKLDHPAFPFDSAYFAPDAPVKKHSSAEYLAASAHYFPRQDKQPFFKASVPLDEKELIIDVRQLKKLARDPLQFYFNETLKIYLKEEEDEEETEFFISHLRKSILRKKALAAPLAQILRKTGAEGKLPRGLLQKAAAQELEEEVSDLLGHLDAFAVDPSAISSHRIDPPLLIPLSNGRSAQIIGTLEDVTPKGLLFHGDTSLKDQLKAWPLYLIYRCLNLGGGLLMTKKGAVVEIPLLDPQKALADYIEYYLLAKASVSPLRPEWASALFKGELEKAMAPTSFGGYESPYVSYLQRRGALTELNASVPKWMELFKTLFSAMGKHAI